MLKKLLKIMKALAFWKKVVPVKIPIKDYDGIFEGKTALVTGGARSLSLPVMRKNLKKHLNKSDVSIES